MKIKKLLCLLLALTLCFGILATSAFAKTEEVHANRYKYKTMYANTFKDVKPSDKYYSSIKKCYDLGLINGKGEGKFDPNGRMTVAEAIAFVVRAYVAQKHPILVNEFDKTTPWYASYVDYAMRNDLKIKVFSRNSYVDLDWSVRNNIDYDRYITCYEFYVLLKSSRLGMTYDMFDRRDNIAYKRYLPITRAFAAELMVRGCLK